MHRQLRPLALICHLEENYRLGFAVSPRCLGLSILCLPFGRVLLRQLAPFQVLMHQQLRPPALICHSAANYRLGLGLLGLAGSLLCLEHPILLNCLLLEAMDHLRHQWALVDVHPALRQVPGRGHF